MLSAVRQHFRQQFVGYIALFLALGMGSAWAAGELGKNSVGSRQIKAGGVRTADLANDAVTSSKVANGTLKGKDFASGQLLQGPRGLTGLPGPTAAFAKGSSGSPVAVPDFLGSPEKTITTPAAGRLLVMFTSSGTNVFLDCTAGLPSFGLYVDGTAVPETRRNLGDNVGTVIDVFGVTAAAVPAGDHLIQIGADCPSGNFSSTGLNDWSIGAVLLGS